MTKYEVIATYTNNQTRTKEFDTMEDAGEFYKWVFYLVNEDKTSDMTDLVLVRKEYPEPFCTPVIREKWYREASNG